ncbi:hypothetical protein Strop_1605 [Salinispora tropica CNB-440]|uniref:Uncharacterized protein n=1 Tax=Salinispora tropica (strain ATCC BAA-916 / DSM 44818 / JCM 13857 / NBRC 105044 / CNB-440) TaxID=369723 RepID=A4X5C1_SALTO|nr:hypothetical protein Strop_1605 [Salinispora tropica CNB-440]
MRMAHGLSLVAVVGEIDTIRAMTATYRQLDHQYGGGHARDTVARYLHQGVTPLLTDGRYQFDRRPRAEEDNPATWRPTAKSATPESRGGCYACRCDRRLFVPNERSESADVLTRRS